MTLVALATKCCGQRFNYVAWEHAECSHFFAGQAASFLVQEYAENGGFCCRQTLCKECGDNAGKHIACSALGKP